MTRALEDLSLSAGYNSAEADLVSDFYVPCLEVAERYDRAVGYFRSSVYHLVGVALSDFALRGGRMRLICSPGFAENDRAVLETAPASDAISATMVREVEMILGHPENVPVVELLATLLSHGSLELRVAYRPQRIGIFHEKLGVFSSASDQLSFTGSTNETFMAWDPSGNHEGFETFGSWDAADGRRVTRHTRYFQSLWDDEVGGLRTVPFPEVPRELLDKYTNPAGVEAAVEKARQHLKRVGRTRSAPRKILQPHQADVVSNWWVERRGIIDHVTGAGKTISALDVLRRWLGEDRGRCAIVLVPSELLSRQWLREIQIELADLEPRLLVVGGPLSSAGWRDSLPAFTSAAPLGPRVTIVTVQSAAGDDFLDRVITGDHLLVIADEVHRLGSQRHRAVMRLEASGRLGLSATPAREHDSEGTTAIYEYFGAILEPHFGIPEAQRAGRLVPYDYFVGVVLLDEDEDAQYRDLTRRIAEMSGMAGDSPSLDEEKGLDRLRIRRARVVKSAAAKAPHAVTLVRENYSVGDRWLVYCEDTNQLSAVLEGLRSAGIACLEYHTRMEGDPPATMRSFERYGGVLVSIRCLDEGVDIPLVDHALILASSTNPREYIQRRGRVLRTAPAKYSAVVHDVLVARETENSGPQVLNRDLERARQFAVHARNRSILFQLDAMQSADEPTDVEFESADSDEQAEEIAV